MSNEFEYMTKPELIAYAKVNAELTNALGFMIALK